MTGRASTQMRRATNEARAATFQMQQQNALLTEKNNKLREKAQLKQIRALRARFGGGFAYEGGNLSNTLG